MDLCFESQACREQDDLIKYEYNLSSCYEAEYLLSLKLQEEMICSEDYYDDFEVRQELPQGSLSSASEELPMASRSTPIYELADNDIDCGYLCDSTIHDSILPPIATSTHLNPDLNLQHQSPFNQPFPMAALNCTGGTGTTQNNGHHLLLAGSCMGQDANQLHSDHQTQLLKPRDGVEGGSGITWTQNGHSMELNKHSMECDPHYEGPSRKRICLQQPEF